HRDQGALRTGALHRGLSPDLLWLVAELAGSPFVHALQRLLFGNATGDPDAALDTWDRGYCPAGGSRPAGPAGRAGPRPTRGAVCRRGRGGPPHDAVLVLRDRVGTDDLRLHLLR